MINKRTDLRAPAEFVMFFVVLDFSMRLLCFGNNYFSTGTENHCFSWYWNFRCVYHVSETIISVLSPKTVFFLSTVIPEIQECAKFVIIEY